MSEHTAEIDAHAHEWVRRQNVTTKGYAMPAIYVCACGAAQPAPRHCATCACVIPPERTEP